jgi:multiple sugar transport system ATP-binding protein
VAAINLRSVSKRYRDGTRAVNDVDLDIGDGELMILVGPSGCGKTTLLRMIAGLEEITSGEILIGDKIVNNLEPRERDVAMVFQNYALYPHMTVAKNMGFALRRAGVPADEIRRKVEEAAELLGISEQLQRKPSNLSGGQRQRVAMGRAIVRDAQVFLMDEPLSNLDAKLRIQMRAEILRIQRRLRTTMVYVTHDQTEAMTLGDRVAVMRDGVLQQVGTPNELYDRPVNAFVAGFIGAPAMNFMAGEITGDELRFPLGTTSLMQIDGTVTGTTPPQGQVVVGIRPEDLHEAARAPRDDGGMIVRAMIDVLESTGSDMYAHFTLPHLNGTGANELPAVRELAAAAAGANEGDVPASLDVIARLEASSRVPEGEEADLWVDTSRLHLFAADTGERLSRASSSAD